MNTVTYRNMPFTVNSTEVANLVRRAETARKAGSQAKASAFYRLACRVNDMEIAEEAAVAFAARIEVADSRQLEQIMSELAPTVPAAVAA